MIAQRSECLHSSELGDLLAGRLPEQQFVGLWQHVDTCSECMATIEQAECSIPNWLHHASAGNELSDFDHEPEGQAIVGQLLIEPFARAAQPTSSLPLETLGPYRLLKWLGSGGMGAVYLAEHQRLKRLAAIKLLPREKLLQSGWLDRFNREMTAIAALEHPHVVRAIDAGDEAGWHYLVMEYLDGIDLSKLCLRMGPISVAAACELMRQAALGLGAIHGLGMIHRDIKPSNLFLTRTGTLKLLDLGLVLSGESPWTANERLTTVGHLMGTLPYMSREQLLDASQVDWRADIYSLGATGFQLLTGRAPYGTEANLAQTIQAISSTACPSIRTLRPDLDEPTARLFDRMLDHDPQERPQSAAEIAQALEDLADPDAAAVVIRTALNRTLDCDSLHAAPASLQSLASSPAGLLGEATGVGDKPGGRSRWPWLVAGLLLPLAFFAGILVTVVTDTGTLVIESSEPGVSVKVSQGEQLVQSLRIAQQPGVLRLSSGMYSIEVSGADGDQLEISDQQVVLLRGQKQVVKITKRLPEENVVAIDNRSSSQTLNSQDMGSQDMGTIFDTGNVYQGKPLVHWLGILEREKDIAVLAQAMQALGQLAESEPQKMLAAKKSLMLARRWGGMIQSKRPESGVTNDPSGWFMTELVEIYRSYYPEPGLQAIIEELEQGNARSAEACLLLLSSYQSAYGNFAAYQRSAMAGSPAGRQQIARLDAALQMQGDKLLDQQPVWTRQALVRLRYQLVSALGNQPASDPQLVRGATTMLERAMHERFSSERSPLSAVDAMILSKVLPERSNNSLLVLGLLEPGFDETEEPELTAALESLAERSPQDTATAIALHFARRQRALAGLVTMTSRTTTTSRRAQVAIQALLANPPDALETTKQIVTADSKSGIFTPGDIELLLSEFAYRLAREAMTDTDGELARKKSLLATNVAALYRLPSGREVEMLELLMRQFPQLPVTNQWSAASSRGNVSYDDLIRWIDQPSSRESDGAHLRGLFQKLCDNYLHQFLIAYTRLMTTERAPAIERNTADRSYLVAVLMSELEASTPGKRQLGLFRYDANRRKQMAASQVFLKTPEGDQLLGELSAAYLEALKRFLKEHSTPDEAALHHLSSLLSDYLTISIYRSDKSTEEAIVVQGLKKLIQSNSKPAEAQQRSIPLGLLWHYVRHAGYDALPLSVIASVGSQLVRYGNCQAITELITRLHDAQPDAFCDFYLRELETNSGLITYGSQNATCRDWYRQITQLLVANPKTRERAIEKLKALDARLLPK